MTVTDAPGFTLDTADWSTHGSALYAIRHAVFVKEQQVPESLEQDEHDAHCLHLLVRDLNGRPIATGRLLADGHLGRVAVLRDWRRRGVGRAVVARLMELAREQGLPRVELHAQTQALAFYETLGFRAEGEEFLEAGIPHRLMYRHQELILHEPGAVSRALLDLVSGLWRSLHIYAPALSPLVFDDAGFVTALRQRATTLPRLKLWLLLPPAMAWRRDCPQLAGLLQTLASAVAIRRLPTERTGERPESRQAFIIGNESTLLRLAQPKTPAGDYCREGGAASRDLLEFFRETWEKAEPDPELRDLKL